MQILDRFEDGSFKVVIAKFEREAVTNSLLFLKADYEPHMEKIQERAQRWLCGEMGHPRESQWYTQEAYQRRVICIHEDMVCCRFTDVRFERILETGEDSSALIEPTAFDALTAVVTPMGPFKAVFEDVLKFPELYAFSARTFMGDLRKPGSRIHIFVTWDLIPASDYPQPYHRREQGVTRSSLEHS